jgi:SAM-dependent methyltransferase
MTADPPASRPALLDRVPMGLGLVVEIGCGEGALGAWLARRDPGARRIGTTADPAAAARAAPHYEAVHVAPPEAGAPVPPGTADLVVLHGPVADWAAAIGAAAKLLGPRGVLLAEIPNAGHWRLAEQALATGLPAPVGGLGYDAMLAAVKAAGLHALDLFAPVAEEAEAAAFAGRIGPVLASLGATPAAWLRRAGSARFLLRASRAPAARLDLVAHALKPVGGVNDVRIDLPLGALATWPGVTVRLGQSPDTPDLPAEAPRVMILHRRLLNTPDAPRFINQFRRRGWVVVQEFDDDPAHWPVIAGSDHFAFRGVHAVQTTTPALEALFRGFTDEVAVFPNTVSDLPEPANFADPSRLRLFMGGLRRGPDYAPYLAELNQVLAQSGSRLAVEVIFERETFDALRTTHKRFHPLLPYPAYRALMARCEIAFMPLADTRFNGFKSDLKFIEAGAHGLACLASPVVYGATIRDGETGMIVRSPAEFGAALRGLLADPARARAMGAAARGWVRDNRMLASQTPQRLAWYRSLWERRAALDAALVARAPELVLAG